MKKNNHHSRFSGLYELIPKLIPGKLYLFMNHGFSNGKDDAKIFRQLKPKDKHHQYYAQLLNQIVKDQAVEKKKILEVGSGRGGNAYLLKKYYRAANVIGLDFSSGNTKFCKSTFRGIKKLSFINGSAMALPFPNHEFDFVLNIESSHCYGDIGAFFEETHRVLKPKGRFLYSDFFSSMDHIKSVEKLLKKNGFTTKSKANLSNGVLQGIERNSANLLNTALSACKSDRGRLLAWEIIYDVNHIVRNRYLDGKYIFYSWILEV